MRRGREKERREGGKGKVGSTFIPSITASYSEEKRKYESL